jgi:hypothetical protein
MPQEQQQLVIIFFHLPPFSNEDIAKFKFPNPETCLIMSAEPTAVDDAEEGKLWPPAGRPRRCSRCEAEVSDQFVSTGEHDDTCRWICPKCGHQEMRSQLDETVNTKEEVSYHLTSATQATPPTDKSSSGLKKD